MTPQTEPGTWMQASRRPRSGPQCMQTEASWLSFWREAPNLTRGITSSGWPPQCYRRPPGGGRSCLGTRRSYLGRPSPTPPPRASPPSRTSWLAKQRGDSLQVTCVFHPWYGFQGIHMHINHGREALAVRLSRAGEDPPRCGVQADWYGEQWVQ